MSRTGFNFILGLVLIMFAVGTIQQEAMSNFTFGPEAVDSPPVSLSRQYWGTFYYPWYGNSPWRHWNERSHSPPTSWASMYLPDDASGVYDPSSELYDSRAAALIDRHLTWMQDAGFDFVLVSWSGQNSYDDQVFSALLSHVSINTSLTVKLGVYYEQEARSDPTVAQIVSDLTYLYDTRANSTAFFQVSDGKRNYPAVFVYAGSLDAVDYVNRWSAARDEMYASGKPVFINLNVFVGFRT